MRVLKLICVAATVLICLCSCNEQTGIHTHSYSSWNIVTQPTCSEAGVLERECSCGHTEQTDVAALGHAYGEGKVIIAPTCTERGQTNYTCKLCGEVKMTIEKKASHTLTDDYIIYDEQHAKECTVCLAITGKEDHFYFEDVCIICGRHYIEPDDTEGGDTSFDE